MNIYALTGCVNRYGRVKLCKTQRPPRIHFDTISGCDVSAISERDVSETITKYRTLWFKIYSPSAIKTNFKVQNRIFYSPTITKKSGEILKKRRDIKKAAIFNRRFCLFNRRFCLFLIAAARLPIGLPLFSFANHIGYWTGVHRQSTQM